MSEIRDLSSGDAFGISTRRSNFLLIFHHDTCTAEFEISFLSEKVKTRVAYIYGIDGGFARAVVETEMESIKKITDIRNDDRPWVKTVTVVEKFMPYQNTTSTTKLQKFILEDDGGCKVHGIMFNRAYHAMSSKLQQHKKYRISNADVKEIDMIYVRGSITMQWIIDTTTVIEPLSDHIQPAAPQHNYIPFSKIHVGVDRSFFDCNICLDLSKDPVVTCCGHLFCWPCLYRWLHIHFDAKECPVCKGEVTTKNLTPIYGRGKKAGNLEDDLSLKIPLRPQARRIESFRQVIQRPTQVLHHQLQMLMLHKSPLTESLPCPVTGLPYSNQLVDCAGSRTNNQAPSLLNQFLAARGLRREQNNAMAPEDAVNLTQSSRTNSEVGESRRVSSSVFLRRSNSSQAANFSHLTSALSSAERLVESYFHNHPVERTQDQAVPVDDRDSISSIDAVIHSESQTVDIAVEIDSTVSHSTSSSRRRHEASRVSDVDSGDSRAPRRRRLA
ncbi:hypothetical protein OROHE_004383 [Orobanche hederae]